MIFDATSARVSLELDLLTDLNCTGEKEFSVCLHNHVFCPGVDQKKIFKFGFNLPNFTTLGGCPLKNWTFVQKLVSYCLGTILTQFFC